MLSNHLILCCPLLLLPSMFFSIRVFFTDLALPMRRPKYLNFSISSSINVQGWFPLVQSLLLSKELWRLFSSTTIQKHQFISARFSLMVCLSYLYMTIGKITALAVWTFVDKVMSVIFNTLSRFVIASLPKGQYLLISWLRSPPTVMLEPKKENLSLLPLLPLLFAWSDGTRGHDLIHTHIPAQHSPGLWRDIFEVIYSWLNSNSVP